MKHSRHFVMLILLLSWMVVVRSQTIWNGPMVTFTKANNAVWILPENQDRITENVWITRANNQGIFNISTESQYTHFSSPSDTEWAYGTTDNLALLTFQNWEATHGSSPIAMLNQDMVLHLISDDIYIDLKFLGWSVGGGGGGFSYQRSTNADLGLAESNKNPGISVVPNPTTKYVTITGLTSREPYQLYNAIGVLLQKGVVSPDEKIDMAYFANGLYLLLIQDIKVIKFLKID